MGTDKGIMGYKSLGLVLSKHSINFCYCNNYTYIARQIDQFEYLNLHGDSKKQTSEELEPLQRELTDITVPSTLGGNEISDRGNSSRAALLCHQVVRARCA